MCFVCVHIHLYIDICVCCVFCVYAVFMVPWQYIMGILWLLLPGIGVVWHGNPEHC